ncbi:O-antigen ligase family protein [Pseudobacteriovorax antillogorgiicola]|uniref:O-Antigen ligase n=1 Tax=Pseudobacteriovorax antillogorgiicola TaxID=1513793 RepID=A0A1Y6BSC1_9BACT|nr:O-antigen ligase family protein [Pseudobacteriovorax antillogorgiicola]TCS54548.1 O-antigen ligase-like membrane protein [Pseudobacteriovorax antillogorgiicola]SMF18506.1 O-Antigen ligase [Pseudobacteriovorax antillogorgiicola]
MDHRPIFLSGLVFLLLTLSSIVLLGGNFIPAVILASALFAGVLIYCLRPSVDQVCLVLLAVAVVLEPPAANPYYDHTPITEILGALFFNSIKKISGIPLPFNIYEMISFLCAGAILVNFRLRKNPVNIVTIIVAASIPLVAVFSILVGQLKGNQLGLAITQIRSFPILPTWVILGFYLARKRENLFHILNIVKWGSLFKAVYAILFFSISMGGTLGDQEYLIDHMSSYILGLAMVIVAAEVVFDRRAEIHKILINMIFFFIYLIPFIINDRRTAMLGLVFIVLSFPALIEKNLLKKLLVPLLMILPFVIMTIVGVVGFAFVSNSAGAQLIRSYISAAPEQNLSYRSIENFNLFQGVRQSPILGQGFGSKYPIYMELPDISHAFELFDAIPHNHVFYIWVFAGPIGIGGLSLVTLIPLISAVRLSGHSSHGIIPIIGFVTFSALVLWLVYVFFDMGLLAIRPMTMTAILIGATFALYRNYVQTGRGGLRTKLFFKL